MYYIMFGIILEEFFFLVDVLKYKIECMDEWKN